ncbi:MAG: glycine cleavage system aminomethyltransferase GcvT [Alphaproteobacteria bacterium]|nr:glycine cleavage system aminomethyltransferase GcvT [Alphaproteobacteria bacterium]
MTQKTALHDLHIDLGAKMGEFAGYDMPLYYPLGVIGEHEWVRNACGLFDVSHMGQIVLEGAGAAQFWERLTPSGFQQKAPGRAQYTVLMNEQGGIIDDLIITRTAPDGFFTVINAGCKEKDIAWIQSQLTPDLKLTRLDDRALLALQGVKAESVMAQTLNLDLSALPYMHMTETKAVIDGKDVDLFISRLGYTGEDGFEISVPNAHAVALAKALLAHEAVKPIGLAARDSLRLEMGYPLYGHDIHAQTSPVEADIGWIMSKNNTGFIGADIVLPQKEKGVARKRIGVRLLEKGVAREGAEIRNNRDEIVGALTSGGFSPSLKESIGQGYIQTDLAVPGQKIFVNVRGRNIMAEVAGLPFAPAKTKSMKK